MKQIFLLTALLLLCGSVSAQRLMFGVRSGANFTDYKFAPVRIGDVRFASGSARAGYEFGAVLRLNLSKHLHLQSELNYLFANYNVKAGNGRLTLRTERLQLPLEAGLQFGVVRLFGGVQFRLAEAEHSSSPYLLKVAFNDSEISVIGGLGLNIGKFFMDFRLSGYPRSRVWQHFTSEGVKERVRISHDMTYGVSVGFFF